MNEDNYTSMNDNEKVDWYSPLLKGYLRGISRELKGADFRLSSVYGSMLVLDSMTRKGARVHIMALNKRYRLIDTKLAHISLINNKELFATQIEEWADYTGAEYIIIGKVGYVADYLEELNYANDIFNMLKKAKLYDYLTVDKDSYRSYMEMLIENPKSAN